MADLLHQFSDWYLSVLAHGGYWLIGGLMALLVFVQLAAGALNIVLLAPVWMQIVHLLLANLLWVALIVAVLETGSETWPS